MSAIPNAPYTGGSAPGADLFYCENFSVATPCGTPRVWNPLPGDSIYSNRDIVLLNSSNAYVRIPAGQGYNTQPWSSTHHAIMFDQEFVVARPYHVPMALNTPYNLAWSIGWQNTYVNLGICFLIEEGPLQHIGGGLVKFYRRFANLPPTRNAVESYCITFPARNVGSAEKFLQQAKTVIRNSRIRYDYFVFDDLNLLGGIPLFPSGNRLNGSTGINPVGLLLPEMRYFKGELNSVTDNLQLDSDQPITNGQIGEGILPTVPSLDDWRDFCGYLPDTTPAEIVAEASSMRLWTGNIYERKTRFVTAE